MQPRTARDFLRVAMQRYDVAYEIVNGSHRTLEAQYIGGYAVECALKALILEKTPDSEKAEKLLLLTGRGGTRGNYHRPEVLLDRLRDVDIRLTTELARKLRRFDWSTDLRYETGRKDTGETYAMLKTAKAVIEWVEQQIS